MAIITISRGTFSGGKAIAEKLGQTLGCPCISKEIILDAAEEFGIPEDKLIAAMESPPRSWLVAPDKRIAHLNYIKYELLKRAKNDNLVYHGSAGHLLLGEISHVIRVRVIASDEYRIKAAMEKENLNRRQAVSLIKKQDKQSINWTKFLYGVDWKDPDIYDAVISLDRISIDSAVKIIAPMTELDDFKPDEFSKAALADQVLSSMVWAALTKDARTNAVNLRVTADNGSVTISGNAGFRSLEKTIEEICMNVEGVKEVIDETGMGSDWQW